MAGEPTPETEESKAEEPVARPAISRRRLTGEALWVIAARIAVVLAGLVGLRLLTEFLPPDIYARVGLLLGVSGLASLLVCMPLNQAAYRFQPEMNSSDSLSQMRFFVGKLLQIGLLFLFVVFSLSGVVYGYWFGGSYVVMILLALLLAVDTGHRFELNLLNAARRQKAVAILQSAAAWSRPFAAIGAIILLGPSADAVFLGYFAASGGLLLLLHILPFQLEGTQRNPNRKQEKALTLSPEVRKQIFTYALPLLPLGIVGWIHSLGDRYIIERMIGLKEAGLYIVAYGLTLQPFQMVEGVLQQTLQPSYNQSISQKNLGQARRIFRIWLWISVVIVIIGIVCFYFLSQWVAGLLLAEKYRSCASFMPWLAIAFAFLTVAHVYEYRLYSLKRTGLVLLGQTIGAISAMLILFPMLWKWQLRGAAIACAAYYCVYWLTMMILSHIAIRQHTQQQTKQQPTPPTQEAS